MNQHIAETHKLRSDVLCYFRTLPALFADTHPDSRSSIGQAALSIGKFLNWHQGWLEPVGSEPIPARYPGEPETIHELAGQLERLGLELLSGKHRCTTEHRLERLTAAVQNLADIVSRQDPFDASELKGGNA